MIAVDFETDGIEKRPDYPPEPRGVAIKEPGKPGVYIKGGKLELLKALLPVWDKDMVFHNASFDLAVATEKLALPMPKPDQVHDTMVLCYLKNPFARSLSLKPSAEEYLGLAPDEQTEIRDWILENVPEARRSKKNWGKWIARAPYEILAPYAIGDVERTLALHDHLYSEKLDEPYRREMRILPGLTKNSSEGIRVDRELLISDMLMYEAVMTKVDSRLHKLLGRSFNIDSNDELADALERSGKASGFQTTPTGKRSVSKDSLMGAVTCKKTFELLNYRGRLTTALQTFIRPWVKMSERDGHVRFDWHQTRSDQGGGARTGRLSSSPNVQNIPKKMDASAPRGLPPLPFMRKYLLPDPGCVWVRKDYSQQELRLLAHFEDGLLLKMFNDDPETDIHQVVADELEARGRPIGRTAAKTMAFALMYGMGLTELSRRLDVSPVEARSIKTAYLDLLPGIEVIQAIIKRRCAEGEPITTWGGREYYVEPPKFFNGRWHTFEYKLFNYLIQGSSADVTKQALGDLFELDLPGRFLCTVHDEINWSVPIGQLKETVNIINHTMQSVKTDVPMLSTSEGGESWGSLSSI